MQTKILPGIGLVLDSQIAGPSVGIFALTHGNEPAGLQAQERFLQEYGLQALKCGKVFLLQINPRAYQHNVRFLDLNMNRIGKYTRTHQGYEMQRLEELLPILEELDVALDIHSVPTPIPQTIGISATQYQAMAEEILGVDMLLVDDRFDEAGSLISYITRRGKPAFGIECGSHQDAGASERALDAMLRLLQAEKMLDLHDLKKIPPPDSVFKFFQEIYPESLDFHYLKPYRNFEMIAAGEVYAQDGQRSYRNSLDHELYLGIIMDKVILGDGMGFLFEKIRG